MRDTLVILPTLNEAENIERMLRALVALPMLLDVLVVDDASTDGTPERVAALQDEFAGRVHLERRAGAPGLGRAYVHGFRWALARDYAYVLEMDADFSHAPADVARLREACVAGAAMAIGSRYVSGGEVRDWSWPRRALSRGASLYARLVLGWPVRDATAGFVCYRREALAALDLARIRFVGYAFQIEMKHALWGRGLELRELPITFVDRVAGTSKMSLRILHEALWAVWELKLRQRPRR